MGPRSSRALPLLPTLLVAGCGVRLDPMPIPVGLAPATREDASRWADSTRPTDSRDLRFRWRFQDQHDAAGAGQGRIRLAPPDSVRLDARGSLGIGRAAGFVVGDTALWAEPEQNFQKLVPNYPLFWAMLGIVRPPVQAAGVRRVIDGTVTAWQFALGEDTLEYVRENGAVPRLIAEVRQGGERLGRVETKFGPDGLPASSRLIVAHPPSKLELTFYQNEKARTFAPDTWTRPAAPGQ